MALAALFALPISGSSAPLGSRIESTRQQVEQTRYREHVLTSSIARYDARIAGLQGQISSLQSREQRVQIELDARQRELASLRDRLERARDRLARLREQLAIAERALAKRLVEIYKADEPDALTVVLEADGFADLLERTEFIDRVSEQDRRIVRRVRELKAQTARQAKELAVLEGRVEAAVDAIAARRNELAAARGELERTRSSLAGARDGQAGLLNRVRSSRVRLEGDLRHLQAENARVQQALQAQEQRAAPPVSAAPASGAASLPSGRLPSPRRGSGRLIWPVNGAVVSPFGMRWGRLHAGVDIAAPSGTPIRAADSGRVAMLGVVGGYGNYTCVQHTASMSTCYAHQSAFATSQGASVRQGQVIGYVGCTGSCFGDHLHFEVRIGGSPVDPMGYL